MSWTAIDLSKLPPPLALLPLSFETILAELKADLALRAPSLAPVLDLSSEPLVKLLETVANRVLLLQAQLNDGTRAVMLPYATGADLDNLAANLGVQRLPGEGDTDFRSRAVNGPEGWSVAGPRGAYVYHALSASPDVADIEVTSPSPANVSVKVLARVGDANPALVAQVAAAVNADEVRPIADRVTVTPAARVVYPVTAVLTIGAGADRELVRASAEAALRAWAAARRKIGRGVSIAAIIGALLSTGAEDVVVSLPSQDIPASPGVAPELGAVSISVH